MLKTKRGCLDRREELLKLLSENIILTALLRLQAKKEVGYILHSVNEADSQVSKAGANLTKFKGSKFTKPFVECRIQSWQAHLERISHFLVEGEGVWWREYDNVYYFKDGDDNPKYNSQGPQLLHFRTATLDDVLSRQKKCWKHIVENFTVLPTPRVSIFDTEGKLTETRTFPTISQEDPTTVGGPLTQLRTPPLWADPSLSHTQQRMDPSLSLTQQRTPPLWADPSLSLN